MILLKAGVYVWILAHRTPGLPLLCRPYNLDARLFSFGLGSYGPPSLFSAVPLVAPVTARHAGQRYEDCEPAGPEPQLITPAASFGKY